MNHILPPPEQATYHDIFAAGWDVRTSEPITDGTAGEDARAWYEQVWNNARSTVYRR